MDMKHSMCALALSTVAVAFSPLATAAVLQPGDLLTITAGIPAGYDSYGAPVGVAGGSWFGADVNGDSALESAELYATAPGSAGGLIVGQLQAPGEIEQSHFFGYDAWLYTVSAPVSGDGTLDFTGLRWLWASSVTWTLSGGAWVPSNAADLGAPTAGYADGVARFTWSGVYGDSYSLWYSATEPPGSPTGCGGCAFFWHLEGTVEAAPAALVPVPAAAWLFASGLLGLSGWRKRR